VFKLIIRGRIPFDVALPQEEYDIYKYFTKEELNQTAKELAYMEKHPEEYKSYNNVNELFEALNNDD